jgi:hypothetical protein
VLADSRYQRSLPTESSRGEPGQRSRRPREEGGGGFSADDPGTVTFPAAGLSTLARVVLWVLLGAAAVLAVLWLVQAIPAGRREPPAAAAPPEKAAAPPSSQPPPGDPADLAAEGRYGEAVHALLLAAIALLARRFRLPLPPSRTSRELLSAVPLEGRAREAFAGLVQTVERSWFGGTPVGLTEYQESVERFRHVSGSAGRGA